MNDDKDHQKPDGGLPPPIRVEPAAEAAPYELAPEPEPAPVQARSPAREPVPGKLADSGLTDDFPEDADFEKDPEVERALKGEPAPTSGEGEHGEEDPDPRRKHRLVKATGDPKVYALVGTAIALAAMVVASVRNSDHWFSAGVLAVYMVALNTVTGVGAIGTVAYFEQARLGKFRHAAARMLVAVAVATLIFNIGAGQYNVITAPLGVVAYLGSLAVLFHWTPVRIIRVAAVHGAMIAVLYLGMVLYDAATGT
jgi:hypothetical protein